MLSFLPSLRKMITPALCAGLGLGSSLLLSACVPSTPQTAALTPQSGPVKVALLVPSGSGQASDELLATSLENAARLAVSDLGGVPVELQVYPTAGQAAQAGKAASDAIANGAQVIIGPVYAAEANAAGVAAASSGVNVLSFSNNPSVAGGNVFVLGPTFANTARRLAAYAVAQGKGHVMVVHDENPAGVAGRDAISAAVSAAGGSVAAVGSYEFSQSGIVGAVPSIAEQARSSGAQSVFLTADTAGALPLLTQLLMENGVNPASVQYIGLTRWDIPAGTLSLPGLQGGVFALPDPDLFAQYQGRYQAAYGQAPQPITGLAYDAIAAIGALAKTGSAPTAGALTQGAGFVGVSGIFRLLPDGTNERGLAVAQVQNGAAVVVDPAPRSFAGAGF